MNESLKKNETRSLSVDSQEKSLIEQREAALAELQNDCIVAVEAQEKLTELRLLVGRVNRQMHLADVIQDPILKGAILAKGRSMLRKTMGDDQVMAALTEMMGTPLGFVTDRDRKGSYPKEIIRDCVIEALLRGLRTVDNEFNIIAGRCYVAKAGFLRLLQELPGMSDLDILLGAPEQQPGRFLVPAVAEWKFRGEPMRLECVDKRERQRDGTVKGDDFRIALVRYETDKEHQALGKAEARMYRKVYQRMTNTDLLAAGEYDDRDEHGQVVISSPEPPLEGAVEGAVEHVHKELAGDETLEEELPRDTLGGTAEPAAEVEPDDDPFAPEDDQGPEAEQANWEEARAEQFAGYTAIRQCNTALETFLQDPDLSDHDREYVRKVHAQRCEQIRASRGSRANK